MSGILDKKSRLFDYQITTEGRKQIKNNDIRFVYASFSDKNIVYNIDHLKSESNKVKVDNSEYFYLPLESSTKDTNSFVNEFKFDSVNKSYTDIYYFSFENDSNFLDDARSNVSNVSISSKIKNQNILLTKSSYSPDTFTFKIESTLDNNSIVFNNSLNITQYPTIVNSKSSIKNIDSILHDKRFDSKINFMKMPPVNLSGVRVFDDSDFNMLEAYQNKSNIDYMFKSFDEKITINTDDKKETITNLLSVMNMSNKLFKKEYSLVEQDDNNTFFIEMFEVNKRQDASGNDIAFLEKLIFIKLEEIFDSNLNKFKDVYLVGKIKYNNREINEEVLKENLKENLRRFNLASNDANGYDFKIYKLANFYCFINMFVLVAE